MDEKQKLVRSSKKLSGSYQDGTIKKQKAYQTWKKLMELGGKMGCHQRADRSLFFRGYQFPICARCFGVMIGYLVSILMFFWLGFKQLKIVSILGCGCMLIDWLLQALKIKESTNKRRVITGVLGGFGLMIFYIEILRYLLRCVVYLAHYVLDMARL